MAAFLRMQRELQPQLALLTHQRDPICGQLGRMVQRNTGDLGTGGADDILRLRIVGIVDQMPVREIAE